MLNIRLSRVGKKGFAQYRVVVAEKTSPVKGKSVEQLGSYNPHTKELLVKKDRIEYWISNGAACSDTVYNLLVENDIIKGDKKFLALKKKEVEGGEEADTTDAVKETTEEVKKEEKEEDKKEEKEEVKKEDKKEEKEEVKKEDK